MKKFLSVAKMAPTVYETETCCGDAKKAAFTILTIFHYRSLRISQFFSALCFAIKNKSATWRCGYYEICENCGFFKFNDFNDFSLLPFANFTIFLSLCYVNYNTSAKRRCVFYKICEKLRILQI